MLPLTCLCFLLPPLWRFSLLGFPFLRLSHLFSARRLLFLFYALTLTLLFLEKVWHLPTLTPFSPHNLLILTDGSVLFCFEKGCLGVRANCSICGFEATASYSAVSLSFSAEAYAILQTLCWSRQHEQVSHFYSFFLLLLSLCPCLIFLTTVLSSISQSLTHLTGIILSLLFLSGHSITLITHIW